ncbi:hypothetical protein [Lacipirellula parvula]|uniref:DUF3137 domain-containing protein n=1 Tax=Lacipirellula parvula TaxID=2650471 RepID=A0A5K7X1Q3_9BACT|nr:hypothetical protein [Lacipirellula parvula]BBO30390.1 hypothetical protein PLANPX_0002 [Lacipirellula parvula]
MPPFTFLIITIVAALFIASVIYSRKRQQERQLALLRLAAKHGWTFDPSNDSTHDARFSHFSVFTNGHSRYAYNTTRGSVVIAGDDWPLQYGDFHYQTTSSNGKTTTTQTHLLSYVILDSPYATAPDLFIRKERFFDRIASAIGFEDIDFESVEFSRDFHVKSSDKRFAYDVVSPQVMEFMLATTPPTVDFRGSQCCLYHGGILEVEDLAATIQWSTEFFEHWPRHVIADLATRRQTTN